MQLPFKLRKTFTTSLSPSEAAGAIERLLNTKSKFFFILPSQYFGYITAGEFSLRGQKGDSFGLFSPRIKGTIRSENPTTIETRFVLPYLTPFFYLIFPIVFLPTAFFTDEMTINGVLREPELLERIGFAFLGSTPVLMFYLATIWPLKRVEAHLIKTLKLQEKHH